MVKKPTNNRLIKRILVPTDGSEGALEAAKYAANLAHHLGARVTILNVVDARSTLRRFPNAERRHLRQELLDYGKAMLTATQTPFARKGIGVNTELREGSPGDVISTVAAETECDLIVIGSRGTGMADSWLLGSVTQQVTRSAPCPVLIVRGRHITK